MEDVEVTNQPYPVLAVNDIVGSLRLQSAPEQIADRILAAIAVGILYPGDRLPSERELTNILGVSRTTLRQAISRLSALGVLEARRGRQGGTFVRPLRPRSLEAAAIVRALGPIWNQVEAMLDYRNIAQQMIAKTAARRRNEADCDSMKAALTAYGKAKSSTESRQADHALHDAIANATKNAYLVQLNRELATAANLGFSAHPYSAKLHDRALSQHTALVEAILDGSAEAAETLAEEHFLVTSTEPWREALAGAAQGAHDDGGTEVTAGDQ
ncbi:MAG: FadR/GntR family transcriptional regulator [Ferrimicrobium sp.]